MMHRRQFVKSCCSVCIGAPMVLLTGCASSYVNGTLEPDGLSVLTTEFFKPDGSPLSYLVVRNEKLEYPICLYRFSENEYTALLMKCTHQGTELQAAGDQLHCSAHGSEFNNKGKVTHGPAETDLRSFQVLPTQEKILIRLK